MGQMALPSKGQKGGGQGAGFGVRPAWEFAAGVIFDLAEPHIPLWKIYIQIQILLCAQPTHPNMRHA